VSGRAGFTRAKRPESYPRGYLVGGDGLGLLRGIRGRTGGDGRGVGPPPRTLAGRRRLSVNARLEAGKPPKIMSNEGLTFGDERSRKAIEVPPDSRRVATSAIHAGWKTGCALAPSGRAGSYDRDGLVARSARSPPARSAHEAARCELRLAVNEALESRAAGTNRIGDVRRRSVDGCARRQCLRG
jgi:hypothetical protein